MAEVNRAKRDGEIAEQLRLAVHRALILSGARVLRRALDLIEEHSPDTVATGQTKRTMTVSPVQVTGGPNGPFMFVTVGPRTHYAKWGIGHGRPPGTSPPLLSLYRWVKEKPGGSARQDWQNWAIARAVQRKIFAEGTPAYLILERALAAERPFIYAGLTASIRTGFET